MNTLRRILLTTSLAAVACGVASADLIVGYSTTLGPTSTDITNVTVSLPSFNPGGATVDDSMLSNVSHAGSGYTSGISMASLNIPTTTYTLVGYDITVQEVLTGSYSVTNTSTNSTANGNLFTDTYNAISVNSPLAPPLTASTDPSNDLFNYSKTGIGTNPPAGPAGQPGEQTLSIGGGPDPAGSATGTFSLAPGQSTPSVPVSAGSPFVDYGAELIANVNCATTAGYNWTSDCTVAHNYNSFGDDNFVPAGTGVNLVSPSDLTLYLSTITNENFNGSGGNVVLNNSLSVEDIVTVSYDIAETSGVPEPTTMALMGGALIGLGLIGKRFKKS